MRRGRDWLEVGGVRVMLVTGSFLLWGAGTPWWKLTQLSALGFVHLSVFTAYFKKEISRPPVYWSVRFKTVISAPLPTLRAGAGPLSARGRAACSHFLLEVPTAPLVPWGWGEARGMGRCLPSGLEEKTSPVHSASTACLTPSAFPTPWHLATSPSVAHQGSILWCPQLPPRLLRPRQACRPSSDPGRKRERWVVLGFCLLATAFQFSFSLFEESVWEHTPFWF